MADHTKVHDDDVKVITPQTENEIQNEISKDFNADDQVLVNMGKAPKMERVYNFWTRMSIIEQHIFVDLYLTLIRSLWLSSNDMWNLGLRRGLIWYSL